jgi:cytochrome c oxidase subunit I+III
MGVYALLRFAFGYISARQPATLEIIGLFIAFSAAQGAFVAALPRLFPGG